MVVVVVVMMMMVLMMQFSNMGFVAANKRMQILGFDIMVDADLKPWLIETNAAPALGLESEVDRRVKPKLINDMVEVIVKPNACALCLRAL